MAGEMPEMRCRQTLVSQVPDQGKWWVMDGDSAVTSTVPREDSGTDGPERYIRAASLGLIGALVILAAVGLFGVRTDTAVATENGYTISVFHSAIARPGLAAPFSVEVSTADDSPLPDQVTVRVDSPYLAIFDDNGMEPAPAESFNDARWTWWTFDVPPGARSLRVDLDARLEPAVQWGMEASAALEIDGAEMTQVGFTTWVMP
jgi:hypothetical protein